MPVVKPKSVHETPERLIKYILDPDKNEKMNLQQVSVVTRMPRQLMTNSKKFSAASVQKNFIKKPGQMNRRMIYSCSITFSLSSRENVQQSLLIR